MASLTVDGEVLESSPVPVTQNQGTMIAFGDCAPGQGDVEDGSRNLSLLVRAVFWHLHWYTIRTCSLPVFDTMDNYPEPLQ